MRLLLMDVLRRRKWFYLNASLYFIAASSTHSIASVGMGLGIGEMLGSIPNLREVLYLPISGKEIWRTRWILALVPIVLSALIRLLVLGIVMAISNKTSDSTSWFLPSSAFQLIYIGLLSAAYIPISYYMPNIASPVRRLLATAALALSAIVLGVLIGEKLPSQWHELTGGTILMLAIGLCLAAISFFHAPSIVPRRVTPMVIFSERTERPSSAGTPDLKATYMRNGRTGLKLLVWCQIRAVLFAGIFSGIASQLPIIVGWLKPPHGPSVLERMTVFFEPIPTGAAITFMTPVLFAAFWILMAPDFLGLRHLRALPLPTRTLAAMFTLIPMLFWLTFWVFPPAAYWILAGHLPSTFRLELLAGLMGLTCLASSAAMHSWVKGPAQFFLLPLLSLAGFITLHSYRQPLSSTVTALIGIVGLMGVALSFLLNDRALRRNSAAHKSKLRLSGPAQARWISH